MTDTAAIIRELDADRLRAEAQAAPHLVGILRAFVERGPWASDPHGPATWCFYCCSGEHEPDCPYAAAVALLEGIGETVA